MRGATGAVRVTGRGTVSPPRGWGKNEWDPRGTALLLLRLLLRCVNTCGYMGVGVGVGGYGGEARSVIHRIRITDGEGGKGGAEATS